MVRETIRWLFGRWIAWLHATGLIIVTWEGADLATAARPMICVANHPSLLDATFLLARLPEAVCILKPAILRNPFLGPAAIMAGYVSVEIWIDLIRNLTTGGRPARTLLIFPEGTRTDTGRALNPLKPGSALIARRAQAPVQIVSIHPDHALLPRGWPTWRAPRFPCHVVIRTGPRVTADPSRSPGEIIADIQQKMADQLNLAP